MMRGRKYVFLAMALALLTTGCARQKELERVNREQATTIVSLNNEIAKLNEQLEALTQAKADLDKARKDLEKKLRAELSGGDVSLTMEDRGLVVTVLDRVLFDSGKAAIKQSATETLNKVSEILNQDTKDNVVYVEGHTDDEPIRYSDWKSNWELSTARATEVIHYLSETGSVNPKRLVASGYGEFQPVLSNETPEGKQRNRRVEIVISPRKYTDRRLEGPLAESPTAVGAESVIK